MKPWEFIIEKPEDLPVFADLLEDWDHPGVGVVRGMIRDGKWPWTDVGNRTDKGCYWFIHAELRSTEHPNHLPMGSLASREWCKYYTLTEAIWAVVNAGKYR